MAVNVEAMPRPGLSIRERGFQEDLTEEVSEFGEVSEVGKGRIGEWWKKWQRGRQIRMIKSELESIAQQQLLIDGGLGRSDDLARSIKERACARLLERLVDYSGGEVSLPELVGLGTAESDGKNDGERRRAGRLLALINSLALPAEMIVERDGQKILTPQKPLPSLTLKEILSQVPDYLLKAIKNFPRRLKEDLENIWAVGRMSRKHQAYCAAGFLAASILPEAAGWLLPVPVLGGRIARSVVRGSLRLGIGMYQEHQRRILEGELDERQRIGVIANLSLINVLAAGAGVSLVGFGGRYLTEGIGPIGRIGQIGAIGLITRAAAFKDEFSSLFERLPKEMTVRINLWGAMEKVASGLLAVAKEMGEKVGVVSDFGEAPGKGKMSDGAVGLAEKLQETRFYIPPGSSFHQQATDWAEDLTAGDELARDNILVEVYRTLRRKFANGQLDESIIWSGTVRQRFKEVEMVGNFGRIVKAVRPQDVVYESNQAVLTDILDKRDIEHLVYVMSGDIDKAKAVADKVCQDGCGPNRVVDLSAAIQKDWQVWQAGSLSAEKAVEGVEGKVRLVKEVGEIGEISKVADEGMNRGLAREVAMEMRDLRMIDKTNHMADSVGGLRDGTRKLEELGSLELKITAENNSVWKAAVGMVEQLGLPLKDGYTPDNFAGGLVGLAESHGLMETVWLRTHPGDKFDLLELLGDSDVNKLGRYLDLNGLTLTEWLAAKTK